MASTQSTVLTAIKTAIDGLTLTGYEEVAIRSHYDDGEHEFPGISIYPVGESQLVGTNEEDRIVYNIAVVYITNDDASVANDDTVANIRQIIRKALIHQKLDGVTGNCTVLWDPQGYDVKNKRNLTISHMLFRVVVDEGRG